jgi:hypothetical protein
LRGVGLDAGAEEEALLGDGDLPFSRFPEGKQRLARLGYQALHDLVHRLVAGCGLSVPEVLCGRVGVLVSCEIGVHALAEGLRAEIVLHGEQHVAGLAVGYAVEHLVDLVGGFGLGADGPRGGLSVQVQRVSSSLATPWSMFHSGCMMATDLFSIQVAKPSLSQRLSHHCMVTRSPNH